MIVVGILLVVLASLLVVGFALEPGGSTEAEFFGLILPNLSARTLVLLGVVLGLLVAIGFALIRSAISRWSQRRRVRRAAAATAAATAAAAAPIGVASVDTAIDPFAAPAPETH